MNATQMIPLTDLGTALFLTGVRFDTQTSGHIKFNGKPIQLAREEHFSIEDGSVVTEQFHFPVWHLLRFIEVNEWKVMVGDWYEIGKSGVPDASVVDEINAN